VFGNADMVGVFRIDGFALNPEGRSLSLKSKMAEGVTAI
jgi:hypothetical protein